MAACLLRRHGAGEQEHVQYPAGQGPLPAAYARAYHLWYAFAGVGALSLTATPVFIAVTRHIDKRRAGG